MLIEQLPTRSTTARALNPDADWAALEPRILAALFHALAGKPYPEVHDAARRQRVEQIRERLADFRARHHREE